MDSPLVLLANEDLPRRLVELLREHGHDVAWVRNQAPGATDREVLNWLIGEERVLVTFDCELAELALHAGLEAPSGVVCFRTPLSPPEPLAELVAEILESRSDWGGHYSVVEEDEVKMLPLSAP